MHDQESQIKAGLYNDSNNGVPLLEVVQFVRDIRQNGGVSGVAARLEEQFSLLGVKTRSFTLEDIVPLSRRVEGKSLVRQKLRLLYDVVVYSSVGSIIAKSRYDRRSGLITLTHNDILFGDVYVNHGLHKAMVFDSPKPYRIILRNPLHLFLLMREFFRYRMGAHKAIVCFSENDAELYDKMYPGTRKKITIIPNGVDVKKFRPEKEHKGLIRRRLGFEESDFVLIFVGYEFDRKGLVFILDALASLADSVKLFVVGGGSEQSVLQYRRKAEKRGVADRVSFLGTRNDIPELLNASDLFVMPTLYETWLLAGLEAMACGVPALITKVNGVSDYLNDGENGFFVLRDGDDIASKVKVLMSDSELYSLMSDRCRETAERYSWDKIAKLYMNLIQKIARSKVPHA